MDLIKFLEVNFFNDLSVELQKSKAAKKSFYTAIFQEQQDKVQKLSEFYGERNAFESVLVAIAGLKSAKNKAVLTTMLRLYGLEIVQRELGYLMMHSAVSALAAKNMTATYNSLVKELAADAPQVIDGLNVPTHALHTPIAGDYIAFNAKKNLGEVKGFEKVIAP